MLRKKVANEKKQHKDPIKWRGHEVTRIEAFSDAVLAFAVTLLIVALEVPETYEELMHAMLHFIPFAICFIILFSIWHTQNIFFRRYGLHDIRTIILNGVLLFTTLFFVYPLKFILTGWIMRPASFKIETIEQVRNLFFIYGGGFAAIYICFSLMYYNAYKRREFLELTPEEIFETRSQVYTYLSIASGGVLSIIIAAMPGMIPTLAGLGFFIIWPLNFFTNRARKRGYAKLFHSDMKADVVHAEIEDELKTIQDDLN